MEHNTFCSCNGIWSICCDNPANYPEYLLCDDFQDSSLNIGEECSGGCIGDWSDSFILHDNPLKEPMCDILIRGTTRTRKIKESYLQECVRRYYNLN